MGNCNACPFDAAVDLTRRLIHDAGCAGAQNPYGQWIGPVRCAPDDGRLLLLTAREDGEALADEDLSEGGSALQVLVQGQYVELRETPVRVMCVGWASRLRAADARLAAVRFMDRHLTDDLLGLDDEWALLQLIPSEIHFSAGPLHLVFDADVAAKVLVSPSR